MSKAKLIMLKGLQASGKSTWAKFMEVTHNWVRVNKDDIRASLDKPWSYDLEKEVLYQSK